MPWRRNVFVDHGAYVIMDTATLPITEEQVAYGLGTIMTFVAMVLGIMSNVIFLSVLMVCTGRQSRLRLFLMHLAVADLFVCCFTIALELGWRLTVSWDAGDVMCRVLSLTKTLGLYAESFIVVAMAVDHYFTVLWPQTTRSQSQRGRMLLALAWTSATVFSVPQAIVFHEEQDAEHFTQCVTLNSFISVNAEYAYVTFGLIAMYGLPLIAVLVINITLVYLISRTLHPKTPSTTNPSTGALHHVGSLTRRNTCRNTINQQQQMDRDSGEGDDSDDSSCANDEEYYVEETTSCEGPSTDLPSQLRVRVHTGLQIRHTEAMVQRQARRRARKLSVLMMATFVVACLPYALAIICLTPREAAKHQSAETRQVGQDEEAGRHLTEGILIFTLCLSTLVNPILYGLYVCYDNWHWRATEARLPKDWQMQLVPVMSSARRKESTQLL